MNPSLETTFFFDFNHPDVVDFAKKWIRDENSPKENAIALYYGVRDSFLYNPYRLNISKEGLIASNVVHKNSAWCVEKSHLFIACCRYVGIPAKPGYAIVVNHIGTEKLTSILKRKEIVFHGYASILIDGKWLKVTPAFDRRICKLSGVETLDFDGTDDALFQAFDQGRKFMEYTHDYGTFEDVPVKLMNQEMKKYYPHLFHKGFHEKGFEFTVEPDFLESN